MADKKAWQLLEYVAHSPGPVTSLSFGRRSGRVMATGGEDCKVNLWAVGKPSSIMSLAGHNTAVESVEFNPEEDKVIAGSAAGSVRVWDLEEVKMIRTLPGHMAGVTSIDFHPFGNFVATGSRDKNIRLWDIARKGCIHTYKGHTDSINMLRFSPDGKWMVSAGEDGCIKIWDLVAGKQLTNLSSNSSTTQSAPAVNCVAFHPTVLLLASGWVDRTVKLYDLENFHMVCSSGSSECPGPVRRISFHPDGHCIYAASNDLLKIYSVEPMECLESVSVGWNRHSSAADMAVAASFNQLIGASIHQSIVSTFVADIKSCAPFVPHANIHQLNNQRSTAERPYTQCGSHLNAGNVTQRRSFVCSAEENRKNPPREEPSTPDSGQINSSSSVDDSSSANAAGDSSCIQDPEVYMQVFHPKRTLTHSPKPSPDREVVTSIDQPFLPPKEDVTHNTKSTTATKNVKKPSIPSKATVVASSNVDVDDFLHRPVAALGPLPTPKSTAPQSVLPMPELEALQRLREPHEALMQVMADRVKKLTKVRMLWSKDNLRTAVDSAIFMQDNAVLVDLLSILIDNANLWTLDLASVLVPHLSDILNGKYEAYYETTCQAVKIILKNFSNLIRQNLVAPAAIGVDIMREERSQKCRLCYDHLLTIREIMEKKDIGRKVGHLAKEIQMMMQLLDP